MDVTDQDFKEKVIEKSKEIPVIVDFWATWCTPCFMLGPILEKIAQEQKEKFVLAKVDVDQAQNNATKYRIMSIPNVKMFKDGKVVDEFVGAIPESSVREWLNKNLED